MSLSCVNIKASLQCNISTVATIWKNKLLVMHQDFAWFQTMYIGMSLISRSCILMSSCVMKKVDQEQLGFEMKWTKGQSINQGHYAISRNGNGSGSGWVFSYPDLTCEARPVARTRPV